MVYLRKKTSRRDGSVKEGNTQEHLRPESEKDTGRFQFRSSAWEGSKEDACYIKSQYAIYDPDITICGGNETGRLFHGLVHPQMTCNQTTRGICWYRRGNSKCVVVFPHPAARVQDSLLLYGLLDALKEIKVDRG